MDRYEALGITNFDNLCKGQCEGTGVIPIYLNKTGIRKEGHVYCNDETDQELIDLWWDAEIAHPNKPDDNWHFVKCPKCNGTGKEI